MGRTCTLTDDLTLNNRRIAFLRLIKLETSPHDQLLSRAREEEDGLTIPPPNLNLATRIFVQMYAMLFPPFPSLAVLAPSSRGW